MAHRKDPDDWICEPCREGDHDGCEDFTVCLCALGGHRYKAKRRKWGWHADDP